VPSSDPRLLDKPDATRRRARILTVLGRARRALHSPPAYFSMGHDESKQGPWSVAYALRKVDLLSFHLRYILLQILLHTAITHEENGPEWGLSILSHKGLALIRDGNMGYQRVSYKNYLFSAWMWVSSL
jgi:hypothetical protein